MTALAVCLTVAGFVTGLSSIPATTLGADVPAPLRGVASGVMPTCLRVTLENDRSDVPRRIAGKLAIMELRLRRFVHVHGKMRICSGCRSRVTTQ